MRPSPSVEDRWVWVPGSRDSFSITSAWETIRPHSSRVGWSGLLWDGGNIPKHSFCAWLAIRDRLSTRDRLSRWDRSIPLSCLLCGGNYESRDHLIFLVILGGRFGRGSFCLCHLLIESVIGGLSYLGFIIRVLGRV